MMKFLFICLLYFLSSITIFSQELNTIELLPPESKAHTDLSFLKNELEEKQLVLLGEITHMYGNIFEMKARLIEYLHQELGFTTIAMESSMYDLWKLNKNGFNKKEFNNAIWGVWSSAIEFQRLVNYIDENNLKVIGFDSQINNTSLFIEDFFDFYENQNIEIKLDEDDMAIIIEGVLENVTVGEEDITYSSYEKELKRIIKEVEKLEQNDSNYYWNQFTKGLLACSQDAYYNKEKILTTDFGNKNDNIRDQQMAENLLSYIDRNPNEKIIAWADNVHFINNNSSIKKPIAKDFISMGSYIKEKLKNKVYSLATIHANDSLLDLGTNKWHLTPIKQNSFEEELLKQEKSYLFVASNQVAMQSTKETRLLNFIDFTTARLDELHDGYIFFKKATLPKKEIEDITISDKPLDLGKTIEPIERGQNIILKGQLLDRDNNSPIPFATLILKKEEIYRVADENGFFELPVKKSMLTNAKVSISSMGFQPKTILLNDLKDKNYLDPNFEALEEVVVKGYLSPLTVLKKAVSNKKQNYPLDPFNFYRYGNVVFNKNDTTGLDLEVITKDCDYGYLSPYVISQRVEQVKWNKNHNPKKYKTSSQFFSYRQNAIRYANILHKRKYKKFDLNFITSNNPDDEGLYIIAFQTERNKWNYTNRGYPTKYSGRVYINKENYAIVKVIENWETELSKEEIEKHITKKYGGYENINQTTIKEENICYYSDLLEDGKYYAIQYFNRVYNETIDINNKKENWILEKDSYLFDFETNDVEEIEYFEYNNKKENSLYRVDYNDVFWKSFYKKEFIEKKD